MVPQLWPMSWVQSKPMDGLIRLANIISTIKNTSYVCGAVSLSLSAHTPQGAIRLKPNKICSLGEPGGVSPRILLRLENLRVYEESRGLRRRARQLGLLLQTYLFKID